MRGDHRRRVFVVVAVFGVVAVGAAAAQSTTATADCSVSPTTVEVGEDVTFDASNSDANFVEFDVDGDGTYEESDETDLTITYNYSQTGTYDPVVRANDLDGSDTASCATVTVEAQNQPPTASVAASPNPGVAGDSITFDGSGSTDEDGSIVEYRWDFDGDETVDRTTDAAQTDYTYDQSGGYTAILTVVDDDGDTDTATTDVVIDPPVRAACSAEPTSVRPNEQVLVDASDSENASTVDFDFDGDGTYDVFESSDFTRSTSYETEGTYTPRVRANGESGQTDTADCPTITVSQNEPPNASLSVSPRPATVGEATTFDGSDSTDSDGSISEYQWDFDGDLTVDRTTTDPTTTFTYEQSGDYRPRLTVVDNEALEDTAEVGLTVEGANDPPTASLSVSPRPATAGEATTFDGSGSSDPDGSVVEYNWDFDGDFTVEQTTTDPSTTYTYDQSGSYGPRLTVTDDDGANGTAGADLTVQKPLTAACSVEPRQAETRQDVTIDASDSVNAVTYDYDTDGDGAYEVTGRESATHVTQYDESGLYTPRVRVTDGGDRTNSTACPTVGVEQNTPPEAAFTVSPRPATAGETTTFDGANSTDPDGSITEYRWDFNGDFSVDRTTTAPQTTYTFGSAGSYGPRLTVVDDDGANATAGVDLSVTRSLTAACSADPTSVGAGGNVTLDAGESAGATSYDFDTDGDGSYDVFERTDPTLVTTYPEPGTYTPVVRVRDDTGRTATAECPTVDVSRNRRPVPELAVSPSPASVGETVTLDGSNSTDPDGTIVEYRFDLTGDGSYDRTTTTPRTTTTYDRAGSYSPTLQVVDDDGGTFFTAVDLTVGSGLTCTVERTTIAPGETTTIDASGSSGVSAIDVDADGDGSYDRFEQPLTTTVSYETAGTYEPTVRASGGDQTATCGTVTVTEDEQPPSAALSVSPDTVQTGATLTFDASASSDPDGSVVEYEWDFTADLATERTTTGPTATTSVDTAGEYTGTVTVVDDDGLRDTAEVTYSVVESTDPVARCTVDPRTAAVDEPVIIDARESSESETVAYDVDGDGSFERQGPDRSIQTRYSDPGTYVPRIRVGTGDRSVETTCPTVTVDSENQPPNADVTTDRAVPTADQPVTLDASGSSDPDGDIVEYRWDFGADDSVDQVTTEPMVTRAYDAGEYAVRLVVVDDDGAVGAVTTDISVAAHGEPTPGSPADTEAPATTAAEPTTTPGSSGGDEGSLPIVPIAIGGAGLLGLGGLGYSLFGGSGGAAGGGTGGSGGGGGGKPTPKPKPKLSGDTGGQYETGAFVVPSDSGTVSVPVGFEPDLIVFTADNGARTDETVDRTAGWCRGMARRTDDGVDNQCLTVGDDAHSTDQATCAVADDLALQVIRHVDGEPLGRVTARVTETTGDSFEVDVSVPGDDPFAGGIRVLYRAVRTDDETDVDAGHAQTATEPGTGTVEVGVDADYVSLVASSAVSATDRLWTTDRSVGLSVGHVTADAQATMSASTWPGTGHGNAGSCGEAALDLLYQDGDRVAGRTRAEVAALGTELRLRYDRTYSGPHKLGSTKSHPLSYLAVAGEMAPTVGSTPLPDPGETLSVDCGFEPVMIEVSIAPAPAGETISDATSSPFGWSEGTAITTGDRLRQYLVHHAVVPERPAARSPVPVPETADAVTSDAGGDTTAADGGRQGADTLSTVDPIDLPSTDGPGPDVETDEGEAPVAAEYGHDGRVGLWLVRDDSGAVVGRDELRVAGTTATGVDLTVEGVRTDRRSGGGARPTVVYRAWPRPGETDSGDNTQ